jgi:long-chain fatty acid transport protein
MSRTVRQVALATCLGAIAVSLAPHAALASAFALKEESAEALGNAFAGQTAKAYDSSTAYYNPAGMSFLQQSEVSGTATWISPDVRFSGQNSNPLYASGIGGPNVSGINGPNVVKPAAIGSIFGVWKINSDLAAGITFAVPYGQRSDYKENWVGRYQAMASDLTDYEMSVDLSYKLTDQLSIGAGVRADYFTGRLSQDLNVSAIGLTVAQGLGNGAKQYGAGAQQAAAGAQQAAAAAAQAAAAGNAAAAAQYQAQAQTLAAQAQAAQAQALALASQASGMQTLALGWAQTGSDGLSKLTGNDYGVGYTFGALYKLDDATRIGFDYKSKIYHNLSGSEQIQLPGNASAAPAAFTSLLPASQDAKLGVTLPDSASVGIYHDINAEWAVMADVQWTDWSVLKQLNAMGPGGVLLSSTQENWKNTWFAAVGANWKPIDRFTFHVGFAFDQTPVTDTTRTARLPDANRYWTAFGVSYAVTRDADIHFGYAHLFTPGGNITDAAGAAEGGGVLTGSYKDSVDIVSSTFALRF